VTGDPFMRMTPLEVAAGWVPGILPAPPHPEGDRPPIEPLAALESVLLDAVRSTPCLVEFSGGRDSSAILAVANRVARREGLPMPVPVTRIFPETQEAGEGDWPELVIRHLGLKEWIRLEIRDELDLLGPTATSGLLRNGLLWPVTAHTKAMTFDHARGGALVTGEGGDEVFGPRRITPLTKLLAGARPKSLGIKYSLGALSPKMVRRRSMERSLAKSMSPWLRPAAWQAHSESVVAEGLAEPLGWGASVRLLPRRRGWTMGRHNLSVVAGEHDVRYVHPLLDGRFLDAFTDERSLLGYPSRTHSMQALFGSLLPAEILTRTTKARFNAPYFHRHSRAFADTWSGEGVDTGLVNAEELKKAWREDSPHAQSLPLMHMAWLAVHRALN
jgi:asparagine synthetase B (glutamine-hydrolysing)